VNIVAGFKGGHSGGSKRILYNFGGVGHNIVPRVDSTSFAQYAPYAFQTLVTPFRGYAQNSIWGSAYALLNLDLYIPLFHQLIPLNTSFNSLKNLQLGLFYDASTTNRKEHDNSNVTHALHAFGMSARTKLVNYHIRLDIGWPGSLDKKPVWYLSVNF
jgi:hypothetical protein